MRRTLAPPLMLLLGLTSLACTPSGSSDGERDVPAPPPAKPAIAEANSEVPPPVPVVNEEPRDAVALAQGSEFACALQRAGTVACWGENRRAQLGQPHRNSVHGAVLVNGITDAVAISANLSSACVVRRSGSVLCWGDGLAHSVGHPLGPGELIEIMGVSNATSLHANEFATCAVTPDATWCWGLISPHLRVGMPSAGSAVKLPFENVRAVHLGHRMFAFLADGRVFVWDDDNAPREISDVVEVNSQVVLECVVRRSGAVGCRKDDAVEVPIRGLSGARSLHVSGGMVVGVLPDASLAGAWVGSDQVMRFESAENVAALSSGLVGDELIALRRDGRVFEWKQERDAPAYTSKQIMLPDPTEVARELMVRNPSAQPEASIAGREQTPPSGAPISSAQAAEAAKRCGQGWAKFKAGDFAGAERDVDAALLVLVRAADSKGLRSLGACLYNRGRIAEQAGDLEAAREHYQRSLSVRENDTVAARLDSLAN